MDAGIPGESGAVIQATASLVEAPSRAAFHLGIARPGSSAPMQGRGSSLGGRGGGGTRDWAHRERLNGTQPCMRSREM